MILVYFEASKTETTLKSRTQNFLDASLAAVMRTVSLIYVGTVPESARYRDNEHIVNFAAVINYLVATTYVSFACG